MVLQFLNCFNVFVVVLVAVDDDEVCFALDQQRVKFV